GGVEKINESLHRGPRQALRRGGLGGVVEGRHSFSPALAGPGLALLDGTSPAGRHRNRRHVPPCRRDYLQPEHRPWRDSDHSQRWGPHPLRLTLAQRVGDDSLKSPFVVCHSERGRRGDRVEGSAVVFTGNWLLATDNCFFDNWLLTTVLRAPQVWECQVVGWAARSPVHSSWFVSRNRRRNTEVALRLNKK